MFKFSASLYLFWCRINLIVSIVLKMVRFLSKNMYFLEIVKPKYGVVCVFQKSACSCPKKNRPLRNKFLMKSNVMIYFAKRPAENQLAFQLFNFNFIFSVIILCFIFSVLSSNYNKLYVLLKKLFVAKLNRIRPKKKIYVS